MTDKQIIIDGIDVSGCEYCLNNKLKGKTHAPAKSMPYAKETSCIECKTKSTRYNFCKHNPNCYYKQLKRAEQKLAKIKEAVKYYAEIRCENCKYLSITCVDCSEIIAKEVIQIIEGKENE